MAQNQQERRAAAMQGVQDAMKATRTLQREVTNLDRELENLGQQKQYLEGKRGTRTNSGLDEGIAQIDARMEELTAIRSEQADALTNAQSERDVSEARLDRVVKSIEDAAGNSDDAA